MHDAQRTSRLRIDEVMRVRQRFADLHHQVQGLAYRKPLSLHLHRLKDDL